MGVGVGVREREKSRSTEGDRVQLLYPASPRMSSANSSAVRVSGSSVAEKTSSLSPSAPNK